MLKKILVKKNQQWLDNPNLNDNYTPLVNKLQVIVEKAKLSDINTLKVIEKANVGGGKMLNPVTHKAENELMNEVLINPCPLYKKVLKENTKKLDELELHKFDQSQSTIESRFEFNELLQQEGGLQKLLESMRKVYDINSTYIEHVVKDISWELKSDSIQVLREMLVIIKDQPVISGAVVTTYFALKSGPGIMLKLYYTLTIEIHLDSLLKKIISEIYKNHSNFDLDKVNFTNIKTGGDLNFKTVNPSFEIPKYGLNNLKLSTEAVEFFKKNTFKVTGSAAVIALLTVNYLFDESQSQTPTEKKDFILQWLEILKNHGKNYGFALGDTIGSTTHAAQKGFGEAWRKDAKELITWIVQLYKEKK